MIMDLLNPYKNKQIKLIKELACKLNDNNMTYKLNIKDESVFEFLKERVLNHDINDRDKNPYYFMKDEMYFKINTGIKVGDLIRIEAFDESVKSRKHLINIYIYEARKYDDVALEMVLIDFRIQTRTS